MSENKFAELDKLNYFIIYGYGHYVMISGFSPDKIKHSFVATTPMLKHILCDMNKKVMLGALSNCQLGGIFASLKSFGCNYNMVNVNDRTFIVPKNKENFQRVQIKNK